MHDLSLILPETALLAFICAVLLCDVFRGRDGDPSGTFWLAIASLLIVLALSAQGFHDGRTVGMSGMFVTDPMATVLKVFTLTSAVFAFFYARDYFERRKTAVGEYYVLGLSAVLGMMLLISAGSLLTAYLGLELMSLSLYAMVALQRDSAAASEAAMKYFVLGALASGMLLYGMSILYGVTGTLNLADLSGAALTAGGSLFVFGLVFILVGVAFKLAVVPFHMWVPDVYQGAATPVTLFIGTAPKIAAFAMAIRLLVDGLGPLHAEWQAMIAVLALASMAVGNVLAIAQSNVKRMLAYSTIAHMGFLLLGILSASASGYAASMFYAVVYALMGSGAFGAVILLSQGATDREELNDFAGFARTSPWFGLIVLILMFSLAGVPPFAGFWAKWFVIKEAIAAGYIWLAVAAVVFSVIGAFYYIRVVKLMYFDAPSGSVEIEAGKDMQFVLSINGLAILALGVMPGALMGMCTAATLLLD
jgi:NADH-quinone oxidoreductase subunit N